MDKLTQIEGIGEKYSTLLQKAGIKNQSQLLEVCRHRNAREILAEKTGISHKLILQWTNQADLARINGISEEYAELLEYSGVDSVPELAQRNVAHLCQAMKDTNERLKLVRHLPGPTQVESWVAQAKTLPPAVHH